MTSRTAVVAIVALAGLLAVWTQVACHTASSGGPKVAGAAEVPANAANSPASAPAVAEVRGGAFYGQTQTDAAAKSASLTVDVDKPGMKVAPTLYGIFFEEINRAGDGGLYAEMVQNRSFEDAAARDAQPDEPLAWTLVADGGAEGKMSLDTSKPLNPKNLHSLKLEIVKAGGRVGIASDGFLGMKKDDPRGMYFKKGAGYAFSVYARAGAGFAGPLTVSLEAADGKVLATGKIDGLTAEWKKFACDLTAADTTTKGRLVVSAGATGAVYLDMVSLFPKDTWKGRPGGLRADLAQMLLDEKPAFVRFPGGCWVEGDSLATAYRWKQTIGDVNQRRNLWNLWRYFSTNGLGFHEYLQLCEDLGAEPLFVINCGMSHTEQREQPPADAAKMAEYVQDALDAIEYANGPSDSKWGALRAQAGHPAPFGLKYMEIGNENGGKAYHERYPMFYKAIKAKYPDMHLVADVWGGTPKEMTCEIVDEHYYSSPEFFINNAGKYDKYNRSGPKVYVGEYAVTQGSGQGNLRAAVGEAAFMTGMERNSDVVVMSSYAPLFAYVYYKGWNPDMIDFDASRVYGTPSYHVQKMFACNRGDVLLPMEVKCPPAAPQTRHGAIGVGGWHTQVEYKDIKVIQGDKVLYQSDFSREAAKWKPVHGTWKVQDGAYRLESKEENAYSLFGDPKWSDYTLTLKARKISGAEGFLILFHAANNKNLTWWNIGGWGNRRHGIEVMAGGKSSIGEDVAGSVETGRWYDIRVETKGAEVRCYLDGKLIHTASYSATASLFAVAGLAGGDVVIKAVNASAEATEAQIELCGVKAVAGGAETVLTGDPADENTLDEPTKVAPATKPANISSPKFSHTFPGNSVTIFRLKTTK